MEFNDTPATTADKLMEKSSCLNAQEEMLLIYPCRYTDFKKIYLTESHSAWITIEWLSDELMHYAHQHYQDLFQLHPIERGKVVMYGEEIKSFRWHQSYLNTPNRDTNLFSKKSYMYSGKVYDNNLSLPSPFQFFLDFLNNKEEEKYNQVTANWYANGSDYIAAHSDCQINMKPNAGIAIVTLNEDENSSRQIVFTPKKLNESENDSIYSRVKIQMTQGCIITMFGDTQKKFRHKVPQDQSIATSRISLTFRKF